MPKRRVKRHPVTQPVDKPYRLIPLTQGQNTIVDAADFEWLSQWTWCAHWDKSTRRFYAVRNEPRSSGHSTIRMHQVILGRKNIDHRNRDGLDNRRENLRGCTQSQNNANASRRSDNTSGFRGVHWFAPRDMWHAQIHVGGRKYSLRYWATAEAAALAYDEAAKRLYGEFAVLNFPHIE